MPPEVKICGLKTPDAVAAAVEGGADYLGFVFFDRSPRNVTPADARPLVAMATGGIVAVGVFVDPDDALLAAAVETAGIGAIQLHGRETPERVDAVKARFGLPVIKALPVAGAADLAAAARFAAADRLLFDAKPPAGADRPGGHGLAYDWAILKDAHIAPAAGPWFLSGGLTPETVAQAVRASGAGAVDVSSGVEDAPGVKSVARIEAFARAARAIR